MQSAGVPIGKALRKFSRKNLRNLLLEADKMTRRDADWCLWSSDEYPATMKALVALHHFDYPMPKSKRQLREWLADAYICKFFRGMKEVVYRTRSKRHVKARVSRVASSVSSPLTPYPIVLSMKCDRSVGQALRMRFS